MNAWTKHRCVMWTGLLAFGLAGAATARAQLQSDPPLPGKQKRDNKLKVRVGDLEWMWQYSPPPEGGREHELIQDPHYHDFLARYFTAPQSFWGSTTLDPRNTVRKTLAQTVDDFLTVPGKVDAEENRYITVTGHVFHFASGRGLVFADLNSPHPLVVFAAIDWIRESHTTDDPDAEYTLWIFCNEKPGTPQDPDKLPPPLVRSLTRWMAEPIAGKGFVQKISAAILVDPDGTPHQMSVPGEAKPPPAEEARPLPKRNPN